jgi:rubrerythrin
MAHLATPEAIVTEIAKLNELLTDESITEALEVSIRNEKAALYSRLNHLEQQAAQGS